MDATLILTGISASLQAVQTWFQYKDSKRAARAFDERYASAPDDPNIRRNANYVKSRIPTEVLDTMGERVKKCWDLYRDVLKGDFLPGEIDKATDDIKACICRELRRIYKLNGSIPEGELLNWWNAYCRASS